ncbi:MULTISPECIES: ketoacyl-ACP synthase III [unclassified Azospirillum]|uniref:ketoacyl-ACP synthase III n=1 Tax=unclassified Azospirillum TaxID=2630922 RepID=UPI000B650D36|nr:MULTISPECIES: ketoacyl-ACP synthase III [unclassified Azospirillum]SNS78354.1 3-oxoacyl-[acyl-carrier-protein] synthase-3 [Azospirillum sp. RU38E]SNS95618.1 3-oxoacyl-[acyl-carrier-protein] synthase-3 [Azospirillum sp. RU37A]
MAQARIQGIALRGIISALPAPTQDVSDLARRFGVEQAERIATATGIHCRHIARSDQCLSDLALPAARALLAGLGWAADSVDLLIVVTQTPDHPLPATACLLQNALGLGRHCAAFDMGLGCSGYIYGLWNVASLLAGMGRGRALLVAGDITSRTLDADDRSTAPLFGDAATVTALEYDPAAGELVVDLGTDGAGAPYLIKQQGGQRCPDGPPLFMDGTQVFAFTLREVPKAIAATLATAGLTMAQIDHVVLHQANEMMLKRLGQKIGATTDQLVLALRDRGNTSSASIPLAISDMLGDRLAEAPSRLLLSGFGVGWSWGTAVWNLGPLKGPCRTLILD